MAPSSNNKKYDVVLFGATGFTGKLCVRYLNDSYGKDSKVKWAVAGRSKAKLEALSESLSNSKPDIIVADAEDTEALTNMCNLATVIATTAGPFARYGNKLVEACVETGTAYCDLTGEPGWVRDVIAKHDNRARETGARIVHMCGHDSIPWDILSLKLANKLAEGNEALASLDMYDDNNLKISGGSVETGREVVMNLGKKKSEASQALGYDPMYKTPSGERSKSALKLNNVLTVSNAGLKPRSFFIMAETNGEAIKRSNALNNYGANVTYREGRSFDSFLAASRAFASITAFVSMIGLSMVPGFNGIVSKLFLPVPGEGPSEESMNAGYLFIKGIATGENGTKVQAEIKFHKDAGYLDTGRMLVESALALALDKEKCKRQSGGVYTPAACQGEVLLDRLTATGTDFEFQEVGTL